MEYFLENKLDFQSFPNTWYIYAIFFKTFANNKKRW